MNQNNIYHKQQKMFDPTIGVQPKIIIYGTGSFGWKMTEQDCDGCNYSKYESDTNAYVCTCKNGCDYNDGEVLGD